MLVELSSFIITLLRYNWFIYDYVHVHFQGCHNQTHFCAIFSVLLKAEVSYLTVEAVWAVQFPDGSSSSPAQIVMADQTHAVCVTLQHTPLYTSNPDQDHSPPLPHKMSTTSIFIPNTPIQLSEASFLFSESNQSQLLNDSLIFFCDILTCTCSSLNNGWNCSTKSYSTYELAKQHYSICPAYLCNIL